VGELGAPGGSSEDNSRGALRAAVPVGREIGLRGSPRWGPTEIGAPGPAEDSVLKRGRIGPSEVTGAVLCAARCPAVPRRERKSALLLALLRFFEPEGRGFESLPARLGNRGVSAAPIDSDRLRAANLQPISAAEAERCVYSRWPPRSALGYRPPAPEAIEISPPGFGPLYLAAAQGLTQGAVQ
jgi:hypothetical protein